ncbi:MAG: hypothetical protein JXR86_09150 [Spirochaetales bacterium]|nr:hypothetical protein [Spirochaetales bacterium]
MSVTGHWLNLNISSYFIVFFLSYPGLWGIGLIYAGILLRYKKAEAIETIINFLLLGLASINVSSIFSVYFLLPFSPHVSFLRAILKGEMSINPGWLLGLLVNSLIYLSIGITLFNISLKKCKKHGLLGQY